MPLPTLNECMVNGTSIFRDTGRHALVGDLFWAKQRVDLEYDSDAFHTSGESLHRDAAKRNALLDNNFTVLTANARHVKELFEMDILANQLRRALHVRSRVAKCRFDDKRKQLRQEVFEAAGLDSLGWR